LSGTEPLVAAVRLRQPAAANGFPVQSEWERATPVSFCHNWQGRNDDPQLQTEVKLLWTAEELFLHFQCRYRTIRVFPVSASNLRKDRLWERDVAEAFLQPDRFGEKYYREFEVSPNGQWLDLAITPQGLRHITSGMRSVVRLDEIARIWTAELGIPMTALTRQFDPAQIWRLNFFRCEGIEPQRFYGAWQPTGTPQPNFHVPEKFGRLEFQP
jgi:Carbohydrate-binding family 9